MKRVGIVSGSKFSRIKKSLQERQLIIEHRLQIGKAYTSIWEPTPEAIRLANAKESRLKSKGGYLHQFVANRIVLWAKRNGYKAEIEARLESDKAVDVFLRRSGEQLIVEIALSRPLLKEISNTLKDFAKDVTPNQLQLLVKDSRTAREIRKLIEEEERIRRHLPRIEVRLAGFYV